MPVSDELSDLSESSAISDELSDLSVSSGIRNKILYYPSHQPSVMTAFRDDLSESAAVSVTAAATAGADLITDASESSLMSASHH